MSMVIVKKQDNTITMTLTSSSSRRSLGCRASALPKLLSSLFLILSTTSLKSKSKNVREKLDHRYINWYTDTPTPR